MPAGDVHGRNSWRKSEFVLFLILERSTWFFSFYEKNRAVKHSKRWKREQEVQSDRFGSGFLFSGLQGLQENMDSYIQGFNYIFQLILYVKLYENARIIML